MMKFTRFSTLRVGARLFCLGMLALILTWPCRCGLEATTFTISGFNEHDVHVVGDSSWIFSTDAKCFYYDPPPGSTSGAGRFLYPGAVQMKDPGATTVKSFSTSFIYQLQVQLGIFNQGPGMAFIIVPDNVTIGAPEGYMGVITADTPDNVKNYESDNHTFAVELDTHNDTMFDDPNDNHIGINLASMNSSHLIKPDLTLASDSTVLYHQIWIDYSEATSTMDIYSGFYGAGQGKPDKPQGSQLLVDLTYLKKSMYIGFSTGTGIDIPVVYAWSFSNDGVLASPIYIGEEAPPAAPPPPPGVSHPPPPGPGPQAPSPGPAKAPPPPSPVPPTPLPVPPTPSPVPPTPLPVPPTPSPSSSSPPPVNSPNPLNPPSFSPSIAPQDPSSEHAAPPTGPPGGKKQWKLFGILLIVAGVVVIIIWWVGLRRPFRIFISNTGGEDGGSKNFPLRLHGKLKRYWWFMVRFRLKVFIDRKDLPVGKSFPEEINKELDRFDLGIVVVSDEYFRKKWPMTELIAFMEAQKKQPKSNRRSRVLPLFYGLTLYEVKQHLKPDPNPDLNPDLNKRNWDDHWKEMAQGDHPLDVGECKAAVEDLCKITGIEYPYAKRDRDEEYIKSVIEKVEKILCEERSCVSNFWWAMPACIQRCRRTPAQKCAMPQNQMPNLQPDEDAGEGDVESHLHNIDDQEIHADCSRHGQSAADRLHRRLEQL